MTAIRGIFRSPKSHFPFGFVANLGRTFHGFPKHKKPFLANVLADVGNSLLPSGFLGIYEPEGKRMTTRFALTEKTNFRIYAISAYPLALSPAPSLCKGSQWEPPARNPGANPIRAPPKNQE